MEKVWHNDEEVKYHSLIPPAFMVNVKAQFLNMDHTQMSK